MKKFVSAVLVTLMMAVSAVPAFAAVSPVATQPEEPQTGSATKDNSPTAPQTGSGDVFAYSLIILSTVACGAAAVGLAKTSKK